MIYSVESLKRNPSRKPVISTLGIENESLFMYGISLVEESNFMIQNFLSDQIHESLDLGVVHEKFDIIETAENIIKWFIEQIKKLFGKFKAYILRVVNSNEYIKQNKDRILSYQGTFDVDFERYFYTCTDSNIPRCDLTEHLGRELDLIRRELGILKNVSSKMERMQIMNRIYDSVFEEDSEIYYGKIRGHCLGRTYPISEDEYGKELFNTYRNGGDYYSAKVSNFEINEVYDRHSKVKQLIKDAEKTKQDIIKSADGFLKELKNFNLKDITNHYQPYDMDEEAIFDRIRKIKLSQLQKICNIYTLAFSAKIDALKDSISQDKKLLYEVITHLEVGE